MTQTLLKFLKEVTMMFDSLSNIHQHATITVLKVRKVCVQTVFGTVK